MNAPSTTTTLDSSRLKRIPSYLRNKLAKLPRSSVATATTNIILDLDSSFETDDSFNNNTQTMRTLLAELYEKIKVNVQIRYMTFCYIFLTSIH